MCLFDECDQVEVRRRLVVKVALTNLQCVGNVGLIVWGKWYVLDGSVGHGNCMTLWANIGMH